MNSQLADVSPYTIRVRGKLDESWFDWLGGITMTFEPESDGLGVTTLSGSFDQAALRGLLTYLWDMNLTVLGVDTPEVTTEAT